MWRKRKLWASCAISYYFLCIISVKYTSKTEERCCRALILLYQICLSPHHDVAIKDQGRSVSVCIFSSQLWGRISKGSPKHFKCSMWILTLQGLCTVGYLKKKKTCSIDRTSWNWIENWFELFCFIAFTHSSQSLVLDHFGCSKSFSHFLPTVIFLSFYLCWEKQE